MKSLLIKKSRDWVLDLLLPRFCVGCFQEGTWLCKKCAKQILAVQMQTCPDCGRINSSGRYCAVCRQKYRIKIRKGKKTTTINTLFLDGIITAAYYKEGPLKELIHNFKYNSVTELKDFLGKMLAETVERNWLMENRNQYRNQESENSLPISYFQSPNHFPISCNHFLLTFTPLHPRRLATRGYNQAEILALETAKRLKIPCFNLLRKIKHTKKQVGLVGAQRRKNLAGVFRIRSKNQELSIKNKKIIIVDDIATTGATLNECAKVLKDSGAKEVWGLVVSRG